MSTKPIILRILSSDNVAIAANKEGIRKGDETLDGVIAREDVPMGHKLALVDFHPNDPVIRYGCVIGRSIGTIPRGTWVQEHMLEIPEAPDLDQIHFTPTNHPVPTPLEGYTFEGYRNPDGTVGTKNVLGISMSVQCVAGMANHIVEKIRRELLPRYPNVDDVIAISHTYGCGVAINAPAAIIPIRTIHNLARNPNLGGEVMVLGLGCEKLRPESILGDAPGGDIVYLQDESLTGFQGMVTSIMQTAERHLQKLNARKRETCPVSDLVVVMQCGGSDAFSGLTGNPVSGFAADLIVVIVGPSGIGAFREAVERFCRQHRIVPIGIVLRPGGIEVIAAVGHYIKRFIAGIPFHTHDAAEAGGHAFTVGSAVLVQFIGLKFPDACVRIQQRTGFHTGRVRGAVFFLTGIGGAAERNVDIALVVERNGFAIVFPRPAAILHDDLRFCGGHQFTRFEFVSVHKGFRAGIKISVMDAHFGGVSSFVAEGSEVDDAIGFTISIGIAEGIVDAVFLHAASFDVDISVVIDSQVAGQTREAVYHYCGLKTGGYHQFIHQFFGLRPIGRYKSGRRDHQGDQGKDRGSHIHDASVSGERLCQ
jgi:altronate dehydratase